MNESLTADDITNSLAMERSLYKGTFIMVEGQTDSRLFCKFIDKDNVRLRVAHSKNNVRKVVKESARRNDDLVIGIIDPDLDLLNGKHAEPPLFQTDCRDMETMIIRNDSLDDILDEYADQERLNRFVSRYGPVLDVVLEASYPVGLMMYVSQKNNYGLSFKELDFERFVDRRSLALDLDSMVQTVLDNSNSQSMDKKVLLETLADEMSRLEDKWLAARGHDVLKVLLIGLRNIFGTYNVKGLDEGALGGALRLAFSEKDFETTHLYADTSRWAVERGVSLWDLSRS